MAQLPPQQQPQSQDYYDDDDTIYNTPEYSYRGGFSTSLCDLFEDPRDRSACCALICCGTFLQDRTTYLLTGERPPPWWLRIVVYGGGCLCVAGIGVATHDPVWAVGWPIMFVVVMAVRATVLRQRVRLLLMQKMVDVRSVDGLQQQQPIYHSTRSEHWCCALVSNDKQRIIRPNQPNQTPPERQTQLQQRRLKRQNADFCFQLWRCLSWCCCDACCFRWCHVGGMCATGQEDRELRRLLPVHVFWRDYITMEPFAVYYPNIEALRQQPNSSSSNLRDHLKTLSQLSRKLLNLLQGSLLLLLTAATFHFVQDFSIAKVVVVVATLAQSFLILYLVYWRHHRSDVSLDAIIKFFASGFVLAMTVSLVVEMVLDLLGEIIFSIVMTNEYIDDHPEILTTDDDTMMNRNGPFTNVDTFKHLGQEHYITLLVYLFFKAVIVAALVEEMTKYFCFWMVEHPDFIYGSARHVNEELGEEGAFCNTGNASASNLNVSEDGLTCNHITPPTSPSESAISNMPRFRPRKKPLHTTAGAAITVGMIATAAGFSCSENLMYVFSQGSVAGGK